MSSPKVANGRESVSADVAERIRERYEVLDPVGEGGMSVVYELRCRRVGTRFALKVARDKDGPSAQRLEREIRCTRKLAHPNCVAAVDSGLTASGRPFLVLEYLQGQPLSALIGNPMGVSASLDIVAQVLRALSHVHGAGVVHRDVKPSNLMLVDNTLTERQVKLFDFGLATVIKKQHRQLGDGLREVGKRVTAPNTLSGTPTYMAPEQVLGIRTDPRSDLYAVGIMLFYLLTGRKPFPDDPAAMFARKRSQLAPTLDDVAPGTFSPLLVAIARKALARNPDNRIATADEFLEAIDAVQRSPGAGLVIEDTASTPSPLRRALQYLVEVTRPAGSRRK